MNPFDDDQEERDRRSAIRSPSGAQKPRRPHKPKKRPTELPRQGDLHTTIRVVEFAELSARDTAAKIGVSAEIIRYHRTNARILNLFDAQGRITAEGRALLALPEDLRLRRLFFAFEASEVGRQWLAWANLKTLEGLAPASASEFLAFMRGEEPHNSTWEAHESALRIWCTELQKAHRQLHLPPQARTLSFDAPPEAVVFDRGGARSVIRALAATTSRVSVATGYFNLDGYRELAGNLEYADLRLLIGNDDQSRDQIKLLLRRFRQSITQALQMRMADKRQIVQEFRIQTIQGRIRIRSVEAREQGGLHAKVYIFGTEAAFVTSANLTGGGLFKNTEAGAVLREREKVDYLQRAFDDLFKMARPIEEYILREIERSALVLSLQDPHLVYLKILLELFGSVDDLRSDQPTHLAEYQKAIVAAVLTRLEAQRGLLLVAPTGIGKTVMSAYIAKVLMERGLVARVYLVCKNEGMRDNWVKTLRSFQITPEIVRVFDLERTSLHSTAETTATSDILDVFRDLRPNDLVIVDECHHFRNRLAQRSDALRTFLRGPPNASESHPFALLLTATPISTGVKHLNALVGLVSNEEFERVEDIASSQAAISVPLGGILRWFGTPAKDGHRGLQHRDESLYFPKLITATKRYRSKLAPVFRALGEYRGILADVVLDRGVVRELIDEEADEDTGSIASGFLISLLARLAESSAQALTTCIDRLLMRGRAGTLLARDPEAVVQALARLRQLVPPAQSDSKFDALIHIIKRKDNREKILIFSEFVATVEYTRSRLSALFPERRIEGLTGKMRPEERRDLLRRFAPAAQRSSRPPAAQEIDILVASDAISEGENLQDARVVINFDLPWTPLKLIQRVGRVDRFSPEPRSVHVYNLFPEGDDYEQVVDLWGRLERRDSETSTISGYSSIGDHERVAEKLAASSKAWLHQAETQDLDVHKLRMDALDAFPHTRLLDRLWNASVEDREAAAQLPDGVQAMTVGAYPGLYVLLRVDQRRVALFLPEGGDAILAAPTDYPHEYFLQRICGHERLKAAGRAAQNFDNEIGALLDRWFAGARPEHCQVVATLKIVAEEAPGRRPAVAVKSQDNRQFKLFDF